MGNVLLGLASGTQGTRGTADDGKRKISSAEVKKEKQKPGAVHSSGADPPTKSSDEGSSNDSPEEHHEERPTATLKDYGQQLRRIKRESVSHPRTKKE